MSWSDKDIDKLYQDRSKDLSFEYNDAYWKEFNASLPVSISGADTELVEVGATGDEVDELYQDGAEQLAFEYKDAYWAEMEAMLPRRRRGDLLWFATSFVFIGLLITSLIVQSSPTSEQSGVVVAQETSNSNEVSNANNNITNTSPSDEMNGNNQMADADVNNVVTSNNNSGNDLGETPAVNGNSASAQNHSNGDSSPLNTQTAAFTPAPSVYGTGIPSEDETGSGTNNDIANIPGTASDDREGSSTDENENSASTASNDNNENIPDETVNEDLIPGPVDALAVKEVSEFEAEKELARVPEIDLPLTRPMMYIEANGGISQSLITPSESMSYSAGLGLGARFQKGKFTFNTGVNAFVSFHDDLVLTRKAKVYGFGSTVYNYTLKFDQLYAVEANLSVGYRLGKSGRHQLTLGVRPSYIFSSKVGFSQNNDETESSSRTVYGYMDGIKQFGIKPMLGYSVDLSPTWTIGLNVGTQVLPSVNEDFINGKNNVLPIDGQLYIRKSLRFRK